MPGVDVSDYLAAIARTPAYRRSGKVVQAIGLSIEIAGLPLRLGELCRVQSPDGSAEIRGEVVGFRGDRLIVMPFGPTDGLRVGSPVVADGEPLTVAVGPELLGRVIDGLGQPIDGKGPLGCVTRYRLDNSPPSPLSRQRIGAPIETGIRVLDGLLTCGKGQRIGIFAGSGVGKSTLMGMIARNALTDVNVVALIGERGREVQEFIDRDLGPEGLARSVVVVSTSDQPPLQRLKGAWVATAIAEYFREGGADVTFLMDSVTRFAMAQREIGLAAGEPPATRGYPPSVFALLPRLMERTGTSDKGTITGFYTVLVEGDDLSEPITDTARGILDGHVVLSRRLANENHFPAIDVLASVSRVMPAIVDEEHLLAASRAKDVLATYASAADLINVGAYVRGSNPQIDRAIEAMPRVREFLRQRTTVVSPFAETVRHMAGLVG